MPLLHQNDDISANMALLLGQNITELTPVSLSGCFTLPIC